MGASEIRVKRIRANQGLGVQASETLYFKGLKALSSPKMAEVLTYIQDRLYVHCSMVHLSCLLRK